MIKYGLGSDNSTAKRLGLIKFIKECNFIELSDDIDEDTWIDKIVPL